MKIQTLFRDRGNKSIIYSLAGLFLLVICSTVVAQPAAPDVKAEMITVAGQDYFRVTWGEVTDADFYKIYASDDPIAEDWGDPIAEVDGNTLYYIFPVADEQLKFFYVTTVEELDFPEWMVMVEGGRFHAADDYIVTLSSFYISKYLVSQEDYEEVMRANPSHFENNPNHPVETISWFDAVEYCNRLSLIENLPPCYSYVDDDRDYGTDPSDWPEGWNQRRENHENIVFNHNAVGYRLPTEMEWEFAARGGVVAQNEDTFDTTYSGSNEVDRVAWYQGNANWQSQRIATKESNELETYDMSGNVYEWCWDRHDDYPAGQVTNPRGPDEGENRVRRGGAWYFMHDTPDQGAHRCEVAARFFMGPERRVHHLGFRVVRNAI